MQDSVVISSLTVGYGDSKPVISNLNLRLTRGSYTVLAGPTGCGKSSLVLALTNILGTSVPGYVNGEIIVNGQPLNELTALERSALVACMWQEPSRQLIGKTVFNEVCLAREYRGESPAEVDRRAEAALEMVGLSHLDREQDPLTLSGGEQQRLALAAVLTQEAPLLLLDEDLLAFYIEPSEQVVHIGDYAICFSPRACQFFFGIIRVSSLPKSPRRVIVGERFYNFWFRDYLYPLYPQCAG